MFVDNGQITGILLAAGRSTRFGSNKLVKKLQSGNSIGLESAETLSASVDNLIIVVNNLKDETSAMFLEKGFRVLAAENANLGMGNSLKSGIKISLDSLGWIVSLADMPFIKLNTIDRLKEKILEGAKICAPFLAGVRGHPVGFNSSLKNELLNLDDSNGAASLFVKYHSEIVALSTTDEGVLHDIDVPEDLNH